MKIDPDQMKVEQAQRISNVGCIGVVILLILLCMIGAVIIRSDLASKRTEAVTARSRILEQVNKAPGVLDRMMAFDCVPGDHGTSEINSKLALLDENSSLPEIEEAWKLAEDLWTSINTHCTAKLSEPAFQDLSTEMEGIRNRISVEKGKYRNAADIYNSAIKAWPASMVSMGFEELD